MLYNAYAHSAAFYPGSLFSSRHQAGSLDVAELLVPKPDATWSWHGANCTKEGTTPRHTRSGSLHTFRLVVSTNPSEKYESVGMMKFPIYGKIRIHVPNHQPALEVSGCPTLKSSMTFFCDRLNCNETHPGHPSSFCQFQPWTLNFNQALQDHYFTRYKYIYFSM